jgi:predicted nucleic acid-binding protein
VAWKRIVNASPLIFLTRLGLLDILNEPGVAVTVPESVLAELSAQDPDDPAAVAARSTDWIQLVATPAIPESLRARKLGAGETSVLALALAEIQTAMTDDDEVEVVLDDGKARRCAESLGLRVQGTLAFLLIGKATGRIEAVRPLLERLRASGMHVSDEVMNRVLAQAGE